MTQYSFNALRRLKKSVSNRIQPTGITSARKPLIRSLTFEALEDRRLLATWDGGVNATGDLWHDPVNWVGDVLPAVGEDVFIGAAFSDTTIRVNQSVAIGALDAAASLTIEGGVFDVADASVVRGVFMLIASELTGSGDLMLTHDASWVSGSMTGAGKTIVDTGATLEISGLSNKYLVRSLENRGAINYDGGNLLFGLASNTSGLIDNLSGGVFTATGDSDITYNHNNSLHAFRNQGTLRHAGVGTTELYVKLDNVGGTIQVDLGQLLFKAGGSLSGTSTVVGNPALTGGVMTVSEGAAVVGDPLEVRGGTLDIAGSASFERLLLNQGEITGAGDLTLTVEATWIAGPMSGDGKTIVTPDATLQISSSANKHVGRTLENSGSVAYDGANLFVGKQNEAGLVDNLPGGLFTTFGESDVSFSQQSNVHVFRNQGTLRHTGDGTSTFSGVRLDNVGGTVEVDRGELLFYAGGSLSGVSIVHGSPKLGGGVLTVDQDSSVIGSGGWEILQGGTLDVTNDTSFVRLTLSGGTLSGASDLTLTEEAAWNYGIMTGTGKTIVAAHGALNISDHPGQKRLGRTLENHGVTTYDGSSFGFGHEADVPALFDNYGLFTAVGESDVSVTQSNELHSFRNQGTLRHTGAGTTSFTSVLLDNVGGTIQVDAGTLKATTGSDAELTGANRLSLAAGAVLDLPGGLTGNTVNAADFYPLGALVFHGSAPGFEPRPIEVMSEDRGPSTDGWSENFAFRILEIAEGHLRLEDLADNAFGVTGEALYVEILLVRPGATLNLNGINVYAAITQIQGTISGGAVTPVPGGHITGPQVSFAAASQTVEEDAGTIALEVTLLTPASRDLSVPIEIAVGGTTASSADYQLFSTAATFLAGQRTTTLEIEVNDDDDAEITETLFLELKPIDGVDPGSIPTFTLTILDNDTPPGATFVGYGQYAAEGNTVTVEVRLDAVAREDVTIPLLVSGTATVDDDFSMSSTSIVIPAGSQRGNVDVSIVDDETPEQSEFVKLEMGLPVNAVFSTRPGSLRTHTITTPGNDVPTVGFARPNQVASEGDGVVEVELTLSAAAAYEITVPFVVESGSTPSEFSIPQPYRVTFPIGVTTVIIPVTLFDDAVREPTERIVLKLDRRQLMGVSPGRLIQHALFIADDEPRLVGFEGSQQTVWEDEGVVNVTITLDGVRNVDTQFRVVVTGATPFSNYALRNQAARPGVPNPNDFRIDHAAVSAGQPVVIPAGQWSVTVPITIYDDPYNETTEWIALTLSDREYTTDLGLPSNLGKQQTHRIAIKDNDPLISIRPLEGGAVREGTPPYPWLPQFPVHPLVLEMTLSAPTNRNVIVPLSTFFQLNGRTTNYGTAHVGTDFVMNANAAAIVVGEGGTSSGALVGFTLADSLDESNETVVVKFAAPIGGGILTSAAAAFTIIDDDGSPFAYYSTASTSFRESTNLGFLRVATLQEVAVKLNRRSAQDLYVGFSFSGTATLGADYSLVGLDSAKRLKIPAGKQEATFLIKTINDSKTESTETIIVRMNSKSTASISTKLADKTRTFKIVDDDAKSSNPAATPGTILIGVDPIDSLPDADPNSLPAIDSSVDQPIGVGIVPLNGALEGTTVFFDANFNGVLDFLDLNDNGLQDIDEPDEPAALSGLEGFSSIGLPVKFDRNNDGLISETEGRWAAVGGADASTDLPWRVPMFAPVGVYVVTPLSTLVESLVRTQGQSAAAAETRVLEALGIEGAALGSTHLPQAVANGDGQAAAAYAHLVQLSNTVLAIADLFAGAPAGLPLEHFADQTYEAIALRIAAPGTVLDLTLIDVIADVITSVSLSTGVALHADPIVEDALIEGAAVILGEGNLAIDAIEPTHDLVHLEAITQVKQVMQGEVAPALRDATAGIAELATVLEQFTGVNLSAKIAAATVGSTARPAVHVLDAEVVEGDLGQSLLEFTVELVGVHDKPVSVEFVTADGLANEANNDYLAVTGSLLWPAGDNTPRIVQVAIPGDTEFEYDEDVVLLLQNPANAFFTRQVARGFIRNDDALTHTLPALGPNLAQLEFDAERVGLLVGSEEIAAGSVSNPLHVEILGADAVSDRLAMDLTDAGRDDSVAFHAGDGAGADTLLLSGGSYAAVWHTFIGDAAGATSVQLHDANAELSVAWDGVETTELHYDSAGELTLAFGIQVTMVVLEDPDPSDTNPALAGKMRVVSPTGQFAPTTFDSDVGSIIVRGYFGAEGLITSSLDPALIADIVFISELPTQGDYNGDRQVDGADLLVWRDNFGTTGTGVPLPGDGDQDQDVDGADFLVWQRHVNQSLMASNTETTSSAVQASVEPVVMPTTVAAFALAEAGPAVTTKDRDVAHNPMRAIKALSAAEARDAAFTRIASVSAQLDQAIARESVRPTVEHGTSSGQHKLPPSETLRSLTLRDGMLAAWEPLRFL